MEMTSNYDIPPPPAELHVAQQSRRERLRITSSSSSSQDHFLNPNHLPLPSAEMLSFSPSFSSRFVSDPRNACDFKPFSETYAEPGFPGVDYQTPLQNWENLHPSFVNEANTTHGLALSLSSNQISEIRRLGFKPPLDPIVNHESRGGLTTQEDSSIRNLGPLGPFTGYATILKSSKFLKPAQLLLDEFLTVSGLREMKRCEEGSSNNNNSNVTVECTKSCGSNDLSGGSGYGGGGDDQSYRPDCHEKKAKLLNMQEEVCKRQKQYQQEIQMVMSAFESVPGLANATPYISRSLKAVLRHFRSLKNAITDQLKYIKGALGEDLSSPAGFSNGDCSSFRYNQNFTKVKSGGFGGTGYQSHIWRPQRGLPERAVSILRAWLFDHFLHPYPTDTDKQMLANQTGLSRNQVSNWFINARVRLWKPMVEEIHMLETRGVPNTEPNTDNSGMSSIVNHRQQDSSSQPVFQPKKQLECSGPSSSMQGSSTEMTTEQLLQRHSSIETPYQQLPTTGMDGSFVGFLPYHRQGLEIGGLGAVSLTLGLRHGSETTQQLHHQFQHQGMHFGGHIHDFSA